MKKILIGMLAAFCSLAATIKPASAQVSLNVNVGTWTPPAEYADVNYYYLPDVDSYYYVPTHQYVYLSGNQWVFRNSLPSRYSYYNIANGYKVAVNRPRAYRYYYDDRRRYARYKGIRNRQVIVRDHYHTRVVNRTRYVNRPAKVKYVNRTPYVNRPAKVKYVNRVRYANRPVRVVNRPNHVRVVNRTKIVNRPNHVRVVQHGGHDRRGGGKGHH